MGDGVGGEMNELVIERGIKLPKRGKTKWAPCASMKVGDSVLVASNAEATSLRQVFKSWKFSERKVNGGTRVWRIK